MIQKSRKKLLIKDIKINFIISFDWRLDEMDYRCKQTWSHWT